MEINEQIIFSNSFGSVTDKRLVLNYKKGSEDLPIGQITSVSYQHKRAFVLAIAGFIFFIGGIIMLVDNADHIQPALLLFISIIGLLSGIANWIGHHNIVVSAGGKDRKSLKAEMSKTKEGREFVNAVKRAIIK